MERLLARGGDPTALRINSLYINSRLRIEGNLKCLQGFLLSRLRVFFFLNSKTACYADGISRKEPDMLEFARR